MLQRLCHVSKLIAGYTPGCQRSAPVNRMMHSSVGCLEENIGGHMIPHDPKEIEEAKERVLKGKGRAHGIPGMDGWEESLASNSEAIVKAERMTGDMSPEDLQKLAVEGLQDKEDREPAAGTIELGPRGGIIAGIDVSGKLAENIEHSRKDPEAKGSNEQ